VWQALHLELAPAGLTVVTVALDTNIEAARPFHDAAGPTHPSLVDPALTMVELFGITNVPFGLWVDERGTIVRAPEVAFAPRDQDSAETTAAREARAIAHIPPERRKVVEGMMKATRDRDRYAAAVRDWVAKGADSEFVQPASAVTARSRSRSPDAACAAAEFELGQHLHRAGHKLDAVAHFEAAHRLDPENWSYPRQAFALVDDSMGNPYGTDLLAEVGRVGVETFYPEPTF
jgi:hypothetical protein